MQFSGLLALYFETESGTVPFLIFVIPLEPGPFALPDPLTVFAMPLLDDNPIIELPAPPVAILIPTPATTFALPAPVTAFDLPKGDL